jgi:hypothetical protein
MRHGTLMNLRGTSLDVQTLVDIPRAALAASRDAAADDIGAVAALVLDDQGRIVLSVTALGPRSYGASHFDASTYGAITL